MIERIDFDKMDGLVPAIIQDAQTKTVLMLGYMNKEAFEKTETEGKVTFLVAPKTGCGPRAKKVELLWVESIKLDCDKDTLLVQVAPVGPVCHLGTDTCWGDNNDSIAFPFLKELENIISDRYENPNDESYTASLFAKGMPKVAQKVGEEATEVVIEALLEDNKEPFLGEAADLLYHYLILLKAKGYSLKEVVEVLQIRHNKSN